MVFGAEKTDVSVLTFLIFPAACPLKFWGQAVCFLSVSRETSDQSLFSFAALRDRKDRMSMYSGLEVRVPFCDHRIVEYAYNMPWHLKAWEGREKGIVRKAFEHDLPEEIV